MVDKEDMFKIRYAVTKRFQHHQVHIHGGDQLFTKMLKRFPQHLHKIVKTLLVTYFAGTTSQIQYILSTSGFRACFSTLQCSHRFYKINLCSFVGLIKSMLTVSKDVLLVILQKFR